MKLKNTVILIAITLFCFVSAVLMVFMLTACSAVQDVKTNHAAISNNKARETATRSAQESESDGYHAEQLQTSDVQDGDVRYVFQYLDKAKSYDNIEDLDANSQIVLIGECISAEPVFQNMTLYTLSKIKVDKVYKGDLSFGDVIAFVEVGGRVTNGEYTKGCEIPEKEFAKDAPELPEDQQLVVGVDGYFPFQQGDKVLLFAQDVSGFLEKYDEPLYGITGGWDGKLFAQENGSFARPLSAETDKHVFGEESLVITADELDKLYKK